MVNLAYTSHILQNASQQQLLKSPLVILHGLFGSKQNWKSLSKMISAECQRSVYALDLRNHGESEWTDGRTQLQDMVQDVEEFIAHQFQGQRVALCGHSLGGKIAMMTAIQHPNLLSTMISVDMPPRPLKLSNAFCSQINCMLDIQKKQVHSGGKLTKQDAGKMLNAAVQDESVKAFLLTNFVQFNKLHPTAQKLLLGQYQDLTKLSDLEKTLMFRVNLNGISQSLDWFAHFPAPQVDNNQPLSMVKSLFIYGTRSDYYRMSNESGDVGGDDELLIRRLFPNSRIVGVDAGHWLHSEKPHQFVDALKQHLNNTD
ncbi:hypothetical protein MP228_008139 [Amoeboaphelidium protococcarum]|nr:hypothetical protein MP228_008139 [Amoeboaphelidium protococcarum]